MKLPQEFYSRNTIDVARDLLGKYLIHQSDSSCRAGKIVETEAYMGPEDKAAHSYNGRRTDRNEVMYGPPGYAYVYFIYGKHFCINAVTAAVGSPEAVLIRALEPVSGIEEMALARYGKPGPLTTKERYGLTNGPGKLCQALGINRSDNGRFLGGDGLYISSGLPFQPEGEHPQLEGQDLQLPNPAQSFEVVCAPRIGVDYAEEAAAYPWRFYIKDSPFVSRKVKRETK
ncbi:DNA-3-methyladenine glycosylase [Aneurinibacillus sp. Ricciae_BoGa-3]|uniref:DNA-3-methyladenine glycosylase n=1 Tax=Aneurinibacillus sp. Ricciae_BoGa-3 TaxID=3022697 RepID=UPI002341B2BE|nr:DNA-3-methyladenine glycosylase [Aneurinibacillus sp. Ricciae_BoGa-3]WCK54428.1 DNA-3-methyladenine glycosylase [Aneurinibacillus sp. Ricciae_BoGa-3]